MLQVPAPATVKRPAGTDMIPERYLRRWDPVTLFFDSEQEQFINDQEANQLLSRQYRDDRAYPGRSVRLFTSL